MTRASPSPSFLSLSLSLSSTDRVLVWLPPHLSRSAITFSTDIIKSWIRYKKSLRSLLRVLQGEKLLFLNACYRLVDNICQDHGRTADALFNDFLSPDWAAPALQVKIQHALGSGQWDSIQGVISEVKDVLLQLLGELQRSMPVDVSAG